jgi:hypothetical protein
MTRDPLDRIRARRSDTAASDRTAVLVALRAGGVDQDAREHLESLGLVIERIVQNKVIGSIPTARLAELRRDPLVGQVDVSTRLRPHE